MNSSSGALENPRSLLILTRALEIGGAERQIVCLAKALDTAGWRVAIAVFYGGGALERELTGTGVQIINLTKSGRWDVVPFLIRLVSSIRAFRPDIVYSFLGGANVMAALTRAAFRQAKLVWGVRASNMDHAHYGRVAAFLHRVEARLSPLADLVIANSVAGADHAIALGFPPATMREVPNGIDTSRFTIDRPAGRRLRAEWGVADDETLVGVMARLDPMKGHGVFIEAAARLAETRPAIRFVCIGTGSDDYAGQLRETAARRGIANRMLWPGASTEPAAALNAMDVLCSPSIFGEGFSNSVSEAMACGVPCVVTDVGDSARIVGSLGKVVEPGDPAALASAIAVLVDEVDHDLQRRVRERIETHFSVSAMVERTAALIA